MKQEDEMGRNEKEWELLIRVRVTLPDDDELHSELTDAVESELDGFSIDGLGEDEDVSVELDVRSATITGKWVN